MKFLRLHRLVLLAGAALAGGCAVVPAEPVAAYSVPGPVYAAPPAVYAAPPVVVAPAPIYYGPYDRPYYGPYYGPVYRPAPPVVFWGRVGGGYHRHYRGWGPRR